MTTTIKIRKPIIHKLEQNQANENNHRVTIPLTSIQNKEAIPSIEDDSSPNKGKGKLEDKEPITAKSIKLENPITLSRCKRILIFMWIAFINLLVNMDHGTIPAVTNEIEMDLQIDTSELGLFGSLVYFGNLIGSIISMLIINKINRKILLFIFLLLNGVGLFAFTATTNVGFLYFDRMMVGSFQAFITIYCPVWVDQYGPRNAKAVMMAIVQIASPLGVVVGYIVTTTVKETNKWTFSYIIQAIIFGVCAVSVIAIPKTYLSITLHCINPPDYDHVKKKNSSTSLILTNSMKEDKKNGENKKEPGQYLRTSYDAQSLFDHSKEEDNKAKNFFKTLCLLMREKIFLICVACLSSLLFISTAIQYWTTNYLINDLKFDSTVIFIAFVVTSLTAPTAGILVGGCIVQKFGGYETKHALLICSLFGVGAMITGAPIPWVSSVPAFTATLWLFLFFGGCVVPNVFGIILCCVSSDLKASANSVTNFLCTLLGYIPAPYIYGVIYKSTKTQIVGLTEAEQPANNTAYGFVIYYSALSVLLIFIATCMRYRQIKRKMQEIKEQGVVLEDSKAKLSAHTPNIVLTSIKKKNNEEDHSQIKIDLVECDKEIEGDKELCKPPGSNLEKFPPGYIA